MIIVTNGILVDGFLFVTMDLYERLLRILEEYLRRYEYFYDFFETQLAEVLVLTIVKKKCLDECNTIVRCLRRLFLERISGPKIEVRCEDSFVMLFFGEHSKWDAKYFGVKVQFLQLLVNLFSKSR